MKISLLIKLCFISLLLTNCVTSKVTYTPIVLTETINVPGTKDENYIKANLWLVDVFISAKSVIQFSDKDAGVIKGKYVLSYNALNVYAGEITKWATFTLYVSDNQLTLIVECNELIWDYYSATKVKLNLEKLINNFKKNFENYNF